tara:strand:+ start:351 stop:560 length:210 start_codon:yes stop_codon:yes gene_type:complete
MPTTTIEDTQLELPLPTRFQQSYTRKEAPVLVPMELELMEELCCDRSAVHKKAIRNLYRTVKKERMNLY